MCWKQHLLVSLCVCVCVCACELLYIMTLKMGGNAAHMWYRRGAYWVLVGTPEGMRPPVRPRRQWEHNIGSLRSGMGAWNGLIWLSIKTGGKLL